MRWTILCFLFTALSVAESQAQSLSEKVFLKELNQLRAQGCYCGSPASPVTYNLKLNRSANSYAHKMSTMGFFSHSDENGHNVVERVEAVGYKWKAVGENLGIGQSDVKEALKDWIESESHCKMLMDPKFEEIGLGRYQKIWVLHLGQQLK